MVAALNAEGVPVGTMYSRPIYLTQMFQRRTLLNWSPWTCPQAKRDVRYAQGDCPVCEDRAWRTGLATMWNWMVEPMPELAKMYGDAFRKVSENYRTLKDYRPDAG